MDIYMKITRFPLGRLAVLCYILAAKGSPIAVYLQMLCKDTKTRSHTDGFRRNNANYWD